MDKQTARIRVQSDGIIQFLHDDNTMEALSDMGRASVRRITNIVWLAEQWVVKDIETGEALFWHKRRDVCVQWEKENLT